MDIEKADDGELGLDQCYSAILKISLEDLYVPHMANKALRLIISLYGK